MKRQLQLIVFMFVAILPISACGAATTADIEADRDQLRASSQEIIPQLVDLLGGQITECWGDWQHSGAEGIEFTSYYVKATVDLPSTDSKVYVDAVEAVGFTITQYPDGNASNMLVGTLGKNEIYIVTTESTSVEIEMTSPWQQMKAGVKDSTEGREQFSTGCK